MKHQVHRFELPILVQGAKAARNDFQPIGERDPLQRPREVARLLAPRSGDFLEILYLEQPRVDDPGIIGRKRPDRRGMQQSGEDRGQRLFLSASPAESRTRIGNRAVRKEDGGS